MRLKKLAASLSAGIFALSACFFNTQLAMANDTDEVYVLMNIPYDEFYQEEISNTVSVDSMSSATKSKTRTGRLTNGSYHTDDSGESIDGITFYVKVSKSDLAKLDGAKVITDDSRLTITVSNRGKETTTTYEGRDALYEAPDYSYYVLSDSETPSYYKTMSFNEGKISFSAIEGTYKTLATLTAGTDISYTFTNSTGYGDFELDFDTDEGAAVLSSYFNYETDDVYGVIIETKEGGQYALRHLENIWLGTKLAWSAGVVTDVHGCALSYEHYKSMVGQNIAKVTYLTEKGKIEITGLNENVKLEEFTPMTDEQRSELEKLYETITELLADYDRDNATEAEGDLYAHMREVSSLLKSQKASVAAAEELLGELPEKIKAVQKERQKPSTEEDTTAEKATVKEDKTTTENETTAAASSKEDTPNTGDSSSQNIFMAVAVIALLAGGAAFLGKKKEA